MAQVILTLKVMPINADVNMDDLETKIKTIIGPDKLVREPIAFGLVALNVTKLVEDAEGQVEAIENKLKSINGVGGVEVIEITRTI